MQAICPLTHCRRPLLVSTFVVRPELGLRRLSKGAKVAGPKMDMQQPACNNLAHALKLPHLLALQALKGARARSRGNSRGRRALA